MKRTSSYIAGYICGLATIGVLLFATSSSAAGQESGPGKSPLMAHPQDRVAGFIDDEQRTTLAGNHHPLARPEYEIGGVKSDFPMEHMIMMLRPDAAQQKALDNLVAAQHDPESSYYRQWITPETYGQMFGISDNDLAQVVSWLRSHGMSVEEVTAGRRSIIFSGSAGQVGSAFRTQIRTYRVGGELHHANNSDPQIPTALAGVVSGLASLHDFHSKPQHGELRPPVPAFTSGGGHYLAPSDFATIYDMGPLLQQSITGSGESIAIVGRTNLNMSDIRLFRTTFGLPANDPQIIINGVNPGIVSVNEEVEADLDVQWSGAVARNASIKFVVSASTNTSDGAFLSAQYIVNQNLASVMSMSFGLCEASLGASGNSFLNTLWQQAAAQGITVLVSSGDSGAAGCDSASATTATGGHAVNGLCSTPYSVCVGGTEFADLNNPSLYWSSTNTAGSNASALSYIPETVWNESASSGLWASGGGVSAIYPKPAWQIGPGVPTDGKRDVPDVSLTSSGHDGYLIYINGGLNVVGGTSAAAPSFAGLMALVGQSTGARQGNADSAFYNLANKQKSGGAPVFHDTTTGNNSVPGVAGYNATSGYDTASGLGSVDAAVLVTHWGDAVTVPTFQISSPSTSITVGAGATNSLILSSSVSGGFNAAVGFSATGLPAGVAATFSPTSLPAPGSGSTSLKLAAASTVAAGSYPLSIAAASGGVSKATALTLTVTVPPSYSISATPTSMPLAAGGSATLTLKTVVNASFNAPVVLSLAGLPAGVTGTFSRSTIPAPGSGTATLTLVAAPSLAPGAYSPVITAKGSGIVYTISPVVNVPGFSLSGSTTSTSIVSNRASLTLNTRALAGFNSSVALAVSGLPGGVTAGFSPASISAPGSGVSTLTLSSSGAPPGAYSLVVTATGGGSAHTAPFILNVPGFTLSTNISSVTLAPLKSGIIAITPHLVAGFSSAVALSLSGLPSGVTSAFGPQTLPSPGNGTSTLTLKRTTGSNVANSKLTLTATGGGVTQTLPITLSLTAK